MFALLIKSNENCCMQRTKKRAQVKIIFALHFRSLRMETQKETGPKTSAQNSKLNCNS